MSSNEKRPVASVVAVSPVGATGVGTFSSATRSRSSATPGSGSRRTTALPRTIARVRSPVSRGGSAAKAMRYWLPEPSTRRRGSSVRVASENGLADARTSRHGSIAERQYGGSP